MSISRYLVSPYKVYFSGEKITVVVLHYVDCRSSPSLVFVLLPLQPLFRLVYPIGFSTVIFALLFNAG